MKTARLAFSGSGFLAGIHAGAASALLDSGYRIVEVAGTSGGSIVGAAVALGMNHEELHDLAVKEDMNGLLSFNFSAMLKGAYCNGEALYAWLDKHFAGARLHDAMMPLQILATSVGDGGSYVFDSTMAVPFALACRASSAVPIIYEPVQYNGKMLVDGGVCNNIPVDRLTVDAAWRVGIQVAEKETFSTSPMLPYLATLVKLLLSSNENNLIHLTSSTGATIVSASAGDVSFLNTRLPVEVKEQLFQSGYDAMMVQILARG